MLEITPGTMMSKNVPGLFLRARCWMWTPYGGFNLQIAFSPERWQGKKQLLGAWKTEKAL
ncbi:MAG: hypothetical protein ACLVJB_07160 [Christensenellales bacterium]